MKYLKSKYYLWSLIVLSSAIYLIYILIYPFKENTIINYLKPLTTVVTVDTVLILIFVNWAWKCKLFYKWLVPFPNLNGTWKGNIKSTWTDPKTGLPPNPIPAILTIKQSFINISCVMRTKEMQSFSFISGFVIDRDNQILRLVYSYDSIPRQIVKDRSPQHFGTIYFDIIYSKSSERELTGDYWTARKTTGSIELKFWKQEKLDKYPEELGGHPVSDIRKQH